MLELGAGEEARVAGDVGEDEIALLDLGVTGIPPAYLPSAAATVLPSVTVETFWSA